MDIKERILTTLACPYHLIGYLGDFGFSFDEEYNKKLREAQKLVDKHNNTINSFATEEENISFHKDILSQIDKIFKQ